MNKPQKSTAVSSVIIGVLLLAMATEFMDHTQEMKRVLNDHSVVTTEASRSIDQRDAKIKNLVTVLNIFTEGRPVLFTGYNAIENQTDSTPRITASNATVENGILALSRDFLKVFDPGNDVAYGDTVLIVVPMRVEDTMNARFLNRGDIFMWDYTEAVNFGVKEGLVYYE